MVGILDEAGIPNRQWKDAKKEIREKQKAKDTLGCTNPFLTDKHYIRLVKDAEGLRCPKRQHALTFITTERERGEDCVYDGKMLNAVKFHVF
jgi:hypothetical protein